MASRLNLQGFAMGRIPQAKEPLIPIYRRTHLDGGARHKVVAFKFRKLEEWLVIEPGKGWDLYSSERFKQTFVPSNDAAKEAMRK